MQDVASYWGSMASHVMKSGRLTSLVCGLVSLMLNQGANFDLAGELSDRSRRTLPCDRSRRPAANQPNPPETTLARWGMRIGAADALPIAQRSALLDRPTPFVVPWIW